MDNPQSEGGSSPGKRHSHKASEGNIKSGNFQVTGQTYIQCITIYKQGHEPIKNTTSIHCVVSVSSLYDVMLKPPSSFYTSRNTAQWFGVGEDCETKQQVWHRKSLRHCSQRYGKLKAQYREPETATSIDQGLDSPATHKMPKVFYCRRDV